MLFNAVALLSVLPLTTAHFTLTWPAARGFKAADAPKFPCGGFNTVSSKRTNWPINGGPIQLNMEHPQTSVEVLLALGSDPGDNFNVVLKQTFSIEGLGDFCVGGAKVPSGLNISDGTLATIQVLTEGDGDPAGGLYQCADVILTTASLSTDEFNSNCKNGTFKVTAENVSGNPNETDHGDHDHDHAATSSGSAVSATSSPGFAPQQTIATWVFGAVGLAGLALL